MLLVIAGGLLAVALRVAPQPDLPLPAVPWWALAVLFAVAQSVVINIEVRREARSASLTELPFVFGLLSVSAGAFGLARVVGASVTQLLVRKQHRHPLKLAFNTVVAAAEAGIGLAVFRLIGTGAAVDSPLLWVAAVAAASIANAFGAGAVAALISMIEADLSPSHVVEVAVSALWRAAALAIVGIVGVLTLEAGPWSVFPLTAACVVIVLAYRTYARLAERHESLERLMRFTQLVVSNPDTDRVVTNLLEQVCDMLHADEAVITFFAGDDSEVDSEAVLRRGEPLKRRAASHLTADVAWMVDRVRTDGQPVLVQRGTRELAARHWLERCGLREAVVAPLHGDGEVRAALVVGDRLGEARGFDHGDVRLLETVANHASIALRNGELVNRLRHDSMNDTMTGLPNRASLEREMDQLFAAPVTPGGFALAMLDLDTFKEVNDTLGHHHGDALLREVAALLTCAVGDRGMVFRFGGDEFAILVPDCVSDNSVVGFCHEVISALTKPVELAGTAVDLGASMGVARAPLHGETTADLVKRANLAMYAAKQGGREVAVFDPAHDTSSPARLALVASLRQTVSVGGLEVYVQPQVCLQSGTVNGVEALARWTDPVRGSVPPDEFIPLAERSGLIVQLTDVILDSAIGGCAAWQEDAPGVGVAVNLSARSLRDDNLDEQIGRLLRRHGVPAGLLTLEITESNVMADPASSLGLLNRLRRRGIQLSIDDFGTGYSSLSYLRRLPVQEVKIDRSFVQHVDKDAENAAIVTSILQLAKALDLTVVAEGVEEEAEWKLLAELGCDVAQGYLISRPMPVADFGQWFRQRAAQGIPRQPLTR